MIRLAKNIVIVIGNFIDFNYYFSSYLYSTNSVTKFLRIPLPRTKENQFKFLSTIYEYLYL